MGIYATIAAIADGARYDAATGGLVSTAPSSGSTTPPPPTSIVPTYTMPVLLPAPSDEPTTAPTTTRVKPPCLSCADTVAQPYAGTPNAPQLPSGQRPAQDVAPGDAPSDASANELRALLVKNVGGIPLWLLVLVGIALLRK